MSERLDFLSDKVANYDLVLVRIVSSPRPQILVAKVERIYSAGKGISTSCLGAEIEFVGCPGHWGQVTLVVGDRALVFITLISGKLYEDAWRGHMVVEEIDGDMYAIFQHRELWLREEVPAAIGACSRQDPKRSYATAIRFDAVEAYLLGLIEKITKQQA